VVKTVKTALSAQNGVNPQETGPVKRVSSQGQNASLLTRDEAYSPRYAPH